MSFFRMRKASLPAVLWGAVCLFCVLFILYPLVRAAGEARIADWQSCIASPRLRSAFFNTLTLTVCSTLLSVAVGYIYAYAVVRGGIPFPRFFSFFPVLHLVTPPFVGGLAFILLFGRQGLVTHRLLSLDVSLYGFSGLLLAQTLCFFPAAFLVIRDSLENINPSLEQAARGMGAGRRHIFLSVTLPLSLPGIVSAALFIAISVLSDFGNPMLIGGRFRVLAVEIYTQLSGWANPGASSVVAIMLLVPALGLFALQRYMLWHKEQRLATVGGRGSRLPFPPPAPAVRVMFTLFCALVSFLIIIHYAVIVCGAFSKIWGVDASCTVVHLKAVVRYAAALGNSLAFAFCAAAGATAAASVIAFFVLRTSFPFRRTVDTLAMLPAAVPGPLAGLAYVLVFNTPPFKLTGTRTIIILAMIVSYLPVAYRMMISTMSQIKLSLDESARSLGAGTARVYSDIVFPLALRGETASFIFSFVQASGTLSTVIFLVSFKTPLVSVTILNLAGQGDWSPAAALSFVLTLAIFSVLGVCLLVPHFRQLFRQRILPEQR